MDWQEIWDFVLKNSGAAGVVLVAGLALLGGLWKAYTHFFPKSAQARLNQQIKEGSENIQIGNTGRDIKIHKGTEVDFDAIVKRLEKRAHKEGVLSAQLQHATGQIQYLEDQNRQLNESVAALTEGPKSGTPPRIDPALVLPVKGETETDHAMLGKNEESTKFEDEEGHRKAAAAARKTGALLFSKDTDKAIAAYREAVALDSDDPDGWNQLGKLLNRTGDLDGAAEAYNRVLSLENRTTDQRLIAIAAGNLAILYNFQGNLDRAEYMYRKSLDIYEALGDMEGMASNYGNLGILYATRGDLDRAEEMYRKSLEIYETLGRKEGIANQYGNLGTLYQTRGDLDRAEEMHRKSLEIEEALERKEGIASEYGNLGVLYKTRGNLDRAEEMYRKGLEIEEALGRKDGMARHYGNLGILYKKRGDLDRAEEMYRKSLEIDEALGRKEGMANQYGNLGILYVTRGELDRAEEMYRKSLDLFREIGAAPQIEQVEGMLAELRDAE